MREYAKKPERVSRTLDSKPKASKQAPVCEVLQRYKDHSLLGIVSDNVSQFAFPLSPTNLNVVGEDHSISGPKRNILNGEIDFCKEKTLSDNYWLENRFRLDGSPSLNPNLASPFADPFYFRIDGRLFWVEKRLNEIKRLEKEVKEAEYLSLIGILIPAIISNAHHMEYSLEQLVIIITNMEDNYDGIELNNYQKYQYSLVKYFVESVLYAIEMWDTNPLILDLDFYTKLRCKLLKNELNLAAQKVKDNFDLLFGGFINNCELIILARKLLSFVAPPTPKMKKSSNDNNLERSKAMHVAAEQNSDKKGVWKIGDAHRFDIENDPEMALRSYNLINMDEFNNQYDSWYLEKTNPIPEKKT